MAGKELLKSKMKDNLYLHSDKSKQTVVNKKLVPVLSPKVTKSAKPP